MPWWLGRETGHSSLQSESTRNDDKTHLPIRFSSGGHGIRIPLFSNCLPIGRFLSQFPTWPEFAYLLIVVVVWCCLLAFGDDRSTNVAHLAMSAPLLPSRRGPRRRGAEVEADPTVAACYARYSSDMQSETSNDDQIQKCLEKAEQNGQSIPNQLRFSDSAVSGTKRERAGFNEMLDAAQAGQFSALYIFSFSRFARETAISTPLLKRLVDKLGIRIFSVADGLDSNQPSWNLVSTLQGSFSEAFIRDLAANVLRGQDGNIRSGYALGDYCFGYRTEIAHPDQAVSSGQKPKKKYVIDDDEANWVRQIFTWFVDDRRSLRWITLELNRLKVRQDHRSRSRGWRHEYISKLLSRTKYIGIWPWGLKKNRRDPETGAVWQEARSAEETQQWVRHLPHLQIVDSAVFARAQELLAENRTRYNHRKSNGTLSGGGGQRGRRLLSGLIECGGCGSKMYVGGTAGKYFFCSKYAQGLCKVRTQLNMDLAEQLILGTIGNLIDSSPDWVARVTLETIESYQTSLNDKSSQRQLESAIQANAQKISRIIAAIEDGVLASQFKERLNELQFEQRQLNLDLHVMKQQAGVQIDPPDEALIRSQLSNLKVLLHGEIPAANAALLELLDRIVLHEVPVTGKVRRYFRGKIRLFDSSVAAFCIDRPWSGEPVATQDGDQLSEVEMDFRLPPREPNPLIDQARAMYDSGMLEVEIANAIGVTKSAIWKWLKQSFAEDGLTKPNGKKRRAVLRIEQEQHLFQQRSGEVLALYRQGNTLVSISNLLKMDRNTVSNALKFAFRDSA